MASEKLNGVLSRSMCGRLSLELTRFVRSYARFSLPAYVWDVHGVLAYAVVVGILASFRSLPGLPADPVRMTARYLPLASLTPRLGFWLGGFGGVALVFLHVAVGLTLIGLVHAMRARQRLDPAT